MLPTRATYAAESSAGDVYAFFVRREIVFFASL
jgi:hypothetical protein